jgi:hypothetical protein
MPEKIGLFGLYLCRHIYPPIIPFVKPFFDLFKATFYILSDVRNNGQNAIGEKRTSSKPKRKSLNKNLEDAQKELLRKIRNRNRKSRNPHLLSTGTQGGL